MVAAWIDMRGVFAGWRAVLVDGPASFGCNVLRSGVDSQATSRLRRVRRECSLAQTSVGPVLPGCVGVLPSCVSLCHDHRL